MKVALDATPLTETSGGIRRYTAELAKALPRLFPQDEYLLVSDQSYQHPEGCGARGARGGEKRWWSCGLPRLLARERVDVFHGTDFAVPYWPSHPAVITVHDLSPWRLGGSARVRRRTPWLLRLGLATMVITPTEAVRGEVIDRFGVPPEEVAAIPLAAADHFRPVVLPAPEKPYFLFAGSDNARKNAGVAREAWRELRRRGYDAGFRELGGLPEQDLPLLFSQAAAVLYPSLYEGFGLPVVEAMQCGGVVIASRDAAISEVAGGACLQCDARDPRQWVRAMEAVLTDAALRERLKCQAILRAKAFSWERTAGLTRAVYEKALRRFHG
ncbi:MAG: D-inositol-3-phosphate glycosyltransferase [Bryobacteraceae bacterium]|nr:D-inositol-3-phosphate glycosyltransferase [Bryobacteraceae bacterium]